MDKEEKKLADAYDRGLLKTENPPDELLDMLKQAGEKTFKKDKRINIRLSSHDLIGIQRKAAQKGIPYQAFISGLRVSRDPMDCRVRNLRSLLAMTNYNLSSRGRKPVAIHCER